MAINPILLQLAREQLMKQAVVAPPDPAMDPAAMGGMPPGPPMDPAMMGGMPPGAMPPMDPAMMGGMPPAAPPMDPAMMAPPAAAPAPAPAAPAADPAAAATQKRKPEDFMQEINGRLYNLENQQAAIMNLLQVSLPPDAAIKPLGDANAPSGGSPEKTASFANRNTKISDKVNALAALMRRS